MITKTERNKMKRTLGNKWIPDVLKILNENEIFNKNGNSFTTAYVSHVFNGLNSHEKIEETIINVYQERLQNQSKMKAQRASVLNIKKTK